MQKRLSQVVRNHLDKCRASAIAAVEVYNRPGGQFRSALYTILIIIAWQAFFHAYFFNRGRKPWYRQENSDGTQREDHYIEVDGEPKCWELRKCLNEYFGGDNPPERENLKFLIGLRNKIEHRDLPELHPTLYGEFQAALMNLEEYLSREFGEEYALSESLAISLQFSRARSLARDKAIKASAAGAENVREYIETFRGGLTDDIRNDIGYSYSVYLVPKVAKRASAADAAIEFIHSSSLDELGETERRRLEKAIVLTKERIKSVRNADNLIPSSVVKLVALELPFVFNMYHHTKAWQYYEVRPRSRSNNPNNTREEYCLYDEPHGDYLYTRAWIKKLVRDLSDKTKFQRVTGQDPKVKSP